MLCSAVPHRLYKDIYFYEEASGRLQAVLDVWTGELNGFVWNLKGTLAR